MTIFDDKLKDLFDKPPILSPEIDFPWKAGTDGDDMLYAQENPDDYYSSILYGLGGNDVLIGGDKADELHGHEGDDYLYGNDGDDWLFGGAGNDSLTGGRGADVLDGGDGSDTADYSFSRGWVMVDLTAGRGYAGDANGDRLTSIENVIGSRYSDYIWGDNGDNRIHGGDGHDQLSGGGGRDSLYGGRGRDSLFGEAGNDRLDGDDGDDLLSGGDDHDRLNGGDGDDRLFGDNGNDYLTGGNGADELHGGAGFDVVSYTATPLTSNINGPYTTMTIDLASGGQGGEATGDTFSSIEGVSVRRGSGHQLTGTSDDNLFGLLDTDDNTVIAGAGNDTAHLYNSGGNDIDGGSGEDTLELYRDGRDYDVDLDDQELSASGLQDSTIVSFEHVTTGSGDDRVWGDAADNRITTHSGNDRLFGGDGNDTLSAGDGNDILNGNDGNDDLWGGSGSDTFVFITGSNDPDIDTVHDFEVGVDRIDLDDTRIDNFEELRDQYATQDGADTLIDTGAGHIRLVGIDVSALQESDFLF